MIELVYILGLDAVRSADQNLLQWSSYSALCVALAHFAICSHRLPTLLRLSDGTDAIRSPGSSPKKPTGKYNRLLFCGTGLQTLYTKFAVAELFLRMRAGWRCFWRPALVAQFDRQVIVFSRHDRLDVLTI